MLRRVASLRTRCVAVASAPGALQGLCTTSFQGCGIRTPWGTVGAAALLAAGFSLVDRKPLGCEAPVTDIKLVTYNVLSPPLANPKSYPKYDPKDLAKDNRLPKVMARLEKDVSDSRIIALQEVDLEWAGKLHTFFAERGYAAVFAQYGKPFNGYMGVMLAWPTKDYEAVDVEICRLSDTAPKGVWPKGRSSSLSPFGYVTYQGLTEILGCRPPDVDNTDGGEWKLAQGRFNEAIFARLRARGAARSFCLGNYHMPCLFGTTEKVRAVNIHSQLLMGRLSKFAAGDPVALMGDFNIKPDTSSYHLLESGGSLPHVAAQGTAPRAEVEGLERLAAGQPMPGGLASAYKAFHGREPSFTNYALGGQMTEPFVETLDYIWFSPGQFKVVACQQLPKSREEVKGPFPNSTEPSDHLPLHATLRFA